MRLKNNKNNSNSKTRTRKINRHQSERSKILLDTVDQWTAWGAAAAGGFNLPGLNCKPAENATWRAADVFEREFGVAFEKLSPPAASRVVAAVRSLMSFGTATKAHFGVVRDRNDSSK